MREEGSSRAVRLIVARNVYTLRREAGLSQRALSDMVGINRTYLSDIENANGNASIDILVRISDGLDVPITKLFEGADDRPPYKLDYVWHLEYH